MTSAIAPAYATSILFIALVLFPYRYSIAQSEVPLNYEQAEGRKAIRIKYKDDFKHNNRELRLELANKLIDEIRAGDDAKIKYGAYLEAMDIAFKENSIETAIKAIDRTSISFRINWLSEKAASLLKIGKSFKKDERPDAFIAEIFKVMESCCRLGFSEEMASMTRLAKDLSNRIKDEAVKNEHLSKIDEWNERFKKSVSNQDEIMNKIVEFAVVSIGKQVGGGECTELAYGALKHAGVQGGYSFGRRLLPGERPRPGDILEVKNAPEIGVTGSHTMIVKRIYSPVRFGIWHQNYSGVKQVSESMMDLVGADKGNWTIYRPGQTD